MSAQPRLGFLGVGWIGRDRMAAIAASGAAQICAVSDADPAAATAAASATGAAVSTWPAMLSEARLDGVVIATPSALHADQAIAALDAGLAVFCQKPLGRNAVEAAAVVAAAHRADRALGVDLSYRGLDATRQMRDVVAAGDIGRVFAAEVVFHNAYGPDKAWFTDRALSGGGCVIDLGTHLVDLVRWILGGEDLRVVAADLHAAGRRCTGADGPVEDHASVLIEAAGGASIHLACSWFLHAGCDAVISATFSGTKGAVRLDNVDGSFLDFTAALNRGTSRHLLSSPPDAWSGRAAVAWARRLGGAGADVHEPSPADLIAISALVDDIYAHGTVPR